MFEIMIFVLVYALWIGFILYLPILFVLRYILVSQNKFMMKEKLFILLMPFSIGFYHKLKASSKYINIYRMIHLTSIILIIIGSLLLFYLHLELTFI